MKHTKHYFLWLSACAFLQPACDRYPKPSTTVKEAPDAENDPSRLNFSGPFSWEDIQMPKESSLDNTPWTDSYWPTYLKGLALRFQYELPQGIQIYNFHRYLKETLETLKQRNQQELARLSPGEKHDLFVLDTPDDATWDQLLSRASTIQSELEQTVNSLVPPDTDGTEVSDETKKQVRQAIRRAAASIYQLIQENAFLSQQLPLVSEGWGLWAERVANPRNQLHGTTVQVNGLYLNDPELRNWSWEGSCHGWAPAALQEPEPKHAVLAQRSDGLEVLFTEGDIRALVSKAWTDLSPDDQLQFVGERCNLDPEEIVRDDLGRTLDAKVSCQSGACPVDWQEKSVHFLNEEDRDGFKIIQIQPWNEEGKSVYLVRVGWQRTPWGGFNRESFYGLVFKDREQLNAWVDTAEQPDPDELVKVQLMSQCRDINPMTFHLALNKLISSGQGFVMDRRATLQVWNQPIKGFEVEYLPIPGSSTKPDELTPVDTIDDALKEFRAPGTRYLTNLEATITWINENGPYTTYSFESEEGIIDVDETRSDSFLSASIHETKVAYTLEFDENRQLIGGEWGLVPVPEQENLRMPTDTIPDFLYRFEEEAEPAPEASSRLRYQSIVRQLQECSLDTTQELLETEFKNEWDEPFRYVLCSLDGVE